MIIKMKYCETPSMPGSGKRFFTQKQIVVKKTKAGSKRVSSACFKETVVVQKDSKTEYPYTKDFVIAYKKCICAYNVEQNILKIIFDNTMIFKGELKDQIRSGMNLKNFAESIIFG